MKYYSAINKNKIMPFAATCMDLEIIILSEIGQTEKDWCHLYMESKKWYKWNLQKRNSLTDIENKLTANKGERRRGKDKSRVWD